MIIDESFKKLNDSLKSVSKIKEDSDKIHKDLEKIVKKTNDLSEIVVNNRSIIDENIKNTETLETVASELNKKLEVFKI